MVNNKHVELLHKRVVVNPIVDLRTHGVGVLLQAWDLFKLYTNWQVVALDSHSHPKYAKIVDKDCDKYLWVNPEHLILI